MLFVHANRPNSPDFTPSSSGGGTGVPTDVVFTIDELVLYLKLPKSTIYKLAQEGQIPGHKVGRHWRFHRSVIDRWLCQEADGQRA
jgi:excisionase family DNA binding protein